MVEEPQSAADPLATLQSRFGYAGFRPLQEAIIHAILDGHDVFVLMPTGGGKSLCYQLPALLLDGITVVVSPLIALMKDQVDALEARGIPGTFLNSSLDSQEAARRRVALMRGEMRLVYVAPERLVTPSFLSFLASVPIGCFAIDEVHCVSEWGHDFRPEYRALNVLRQRFPGTPIAAFTATATRRVEADVIAQLGLEQAARFHGNFNRPNLSYAVHPKRNADRQLLDYLETHKHVAGIVYCQSRAETERVAHLLSDAHFSAAAYHAGLSSEERKARQEAFLCGETRIIVATIAFGMGIDKPDVRFVLHYDLPRSLEGYYQESGRAGRDGEPSDCILFYSPGDAGKIEYFISQKAEPERRVASWQLNQVRDYARTTRCRRRFLLAYFDEALDGQTGRCCDLCGEPPQRENYTTAAQMLLSAAKRTGERFQSPYLIEVLRGERTERVLARGHDKLPTHGVGRGRSAEEWRNIAQQLIADGYLHREELGGLIVTPRGNDVLFHGAQVLLVSPPTARRRRAQTARGGSTESGGAESQELPHLPARVQRQWS